MTQNMRRIKAPVGNAPIIYQPYEFGNTKSQGLVQSWCLPIPYHVNENSNFEFDLFLKVYDERIKNNASTNPWGVLSTKFESKTWVNLKEFASVAQTSFKLGADCVFINPNVELEPFYISPWEHGVNYHAELSVVLDWLENESIMLAVRCVDADRFAMCNYFIATPAFWRAYLEFVSNIMTIIYTQAPPFVVDALSGVGSYEYNRKAPLRVFFIERLFTQFICSSDFNVSSMSLLRQLTLRLGEACGSLVYQLSQLKSMSIKQNSASALQKWDDARRELYPIFLKEFRKRTAVAQSPASMRRN